MKISKISLVFKKAPFPAIMTITSLVLFIGIYLLVTMTTIEPYYFAGLIFAVPFVFFGIITFFTVTGKLRIIVSSIITGILIFVLGFSALCAFVFIGFEAATTITTDIGKYERVLKLTDYPSNSLIEYFPNKIPDSAKGIVFTYNPAFLQGGERFGLKFETDSNSIDNYINELSKKAKWIGKSSESQAKENGILPSAFDFLGYTDLPEDFTIYLVASKPYHPNDWNHGKLSLAAISKTRNEIIFLAEDW